MTEDIYIVAGNTCEVNVDVEGEYILNCVNITGLLAITTVNSTVDYITFQYPNELTGTTSIQTTKPTITFRSTMTASLIPTITKEVCYENKTDGLLYYKYTITDCSDRMKYLLGIKNFPAVADTTFQAQPSLNGPTFFQVVCDKLTGCGLVSANTFIVGSIFELQGPSYVGDMSQVTFAIRGVYDEDIDIDSDLLWHFQLTKLPPLKQGKKTERSNQEKNADMRMVLQYGKRI